MDGRIKKIRERLSDISNHRDCLHLKPEDGQRRRGSNCEYPQPTGHMIDDREIYGREDDRKKLMDWLFSDKESKCKVLAVVGKGGLGKTTFAQLVYNDPKVEGYFKERMWISVSDDFDPIRLTRAMIESITEDSCGLSELSVLQRSLQKKLDGKRVLLVLDDVWNDEQSLWESLRSPFGSAQMIRIIVTTRNTSVAKVMQTTDPHLLDHLPEEQCRKLFMRLAFCDRDPKQFPSLVDIGEKIVKKFDGLPLSVKSLGGLLRSESDEDRWNDVLHSELWDEKTNILTALKLSYIRMPSHLRPCFQICSIFPKAFIFYKDELVKLWAAHGYIQHKGEKDSTEEIGHKYFDELYGRSFFDALPILMEDERIYKLHDNIHDLARYVLGEREGEHKMRHLYIKNESLASHIDNNDALRTLMVGPEINMPFIHDVLGRNTTRLAHLRYFNILPYSLVYLPYTYRVEVRGEEEFSLPEGIGNLICLRHLALANTSGGMIKLPNSIGLMYNLVVLKIICHGLVELPDTDTLRNLVSLTTIYFSGFRNDQLPALGQLPSLRSLTLRSFKNVKSIGNEFCRGGNGNNRNNVAFPTLTSLVLRDLDNWKKWDELQEGDFPQLQKLQIESCSNISSLSSLGHLNLLSHIVISYCLSLRLSTGSSYPPNLKILEHFGFSKLCWPKRSGEVKKLERVRGVFWVTIDELFGILEKMVRLKCLTLLNADSGARLIDENGRYHERKEDLCLVIEGGDDASFSLLKTLLPGTLLDLEYLTSIYFCGFHIDQLPALGQLPSLKSLTLMKLDKVKSIGNELYRAGNNRHCVAFPSLTSLVLNQLTNLRKWDELQEGDFPQLRKLDIIYCRRLSSISPLRNLGLLSHVSLGDCRWLQLPPVSSFPPNLTNLHNAGNLKLCLPQGFGELKKLERLSGIFGVRMDEAIGILLKLVSVKHLSISEIWNAHCAWNGEAGLREYAAIEKLLLNWAPVNELHELVEFLGIPFDEDEDLHLAVERDHKGSHHSDDSEKDYSDDAAGEDEDISDDDDGDETGENEDASDDDDGDETEEDEDPSEDDDNNQGRNQ